LNAAAFFTDRCAGGEMKMERQEKDKQQRGDADDAGDYVRLGGQRSEHEKNLAQRICRCQ
jgi:hypothetical protein